MAFIKKLIKNKKQMKYLLAVLLIAFSFNGFAQQNELVWHTDANKAINLSVQSGKPLYIFFTGSDWCGWCKKLVREVFVKPEFATWAAKNVILVEVDFPRKKKLDQKITQQNNSLLQTFSPFYEQNYGRRMGYPTGFFVNAKVKDGKVLLLDGVLGSQGYVAGGPSAWIAGANKILKK
jgi:protein disulfide-isomerase